MVLKKWVVSLFVSYRSVSSRHVGIHGYPVECFFIHKYVGFPALTCMYTVQDGCSRDVLTIGASDYLIRVGFRPLQDGCSSNGVDMKGTSAAISPSPSSDTPPCSSTTVNKYYCTIHEWYTDRSLSTLRPSSYLHQKTSEGMFQKTKVAEFL